MRRKQREGVEREKDGRDLEESGVKKEKAINIVVFCEFTYFAGSEKQMKHTL